MNGTLNKVMLIGFLGDDIKMHYFDGGNCIGRFQLATNEVYINKTTNEKITSTEWHNLVVRNKAAELCEKYLSKGEKYTWKDALSPANGNQRMEVRNTPPKFR